MKTIEQLLNEKFAEKLENGDFEKIIEESLNKMVQNSLDYLTSYGSPLIREIENKLLPILSTAIANSELDNLANKITLLLNRIMVNSELSKLENIENSLKDYLGYSVRKIKTIKLSDIFNEYVNFAKDKCSQLYISENDVEYEDGIATLYFDVRLERVEEEKKYFRRTKYKLSVDYCGDFINEYSDNPELDIEFEIDDYSCIGFSAPIDLARLTYYPSFIWFLIQLSNNFVKIEIDQPSFSKVIEVEIEEDE